MNAETKRFWIGAGVLPLLLFLGQTICVWPAPQWLGEFAFALLFVTPLLMLPILAAPFAAIYQLIKGVVRRAEAGAFKQACLSALACICFIGLSLTALIQAQHVRRNGFLRASQTGDQIVQALLRYKSEQGQYPEKLQQLVPKYLSHIPYTTLIGYPDFEYTKDRNDLEVRPGEYELRISCSSGGINFDRFIYWPSEVYSDRIQGNRIERIGTWAYMHE